jgi:hypothetical protein
METRSTRENSCWNVVDLLCPDMGSNRVDLSAFAAPVWAYVKPVHGLAQRALFAAWFGWCAVLGTLLLGETGEFRSLSFVVTYFESVSRNFDDHVIRQLCVRRRW